MKKLLLVFVTVLLAVSGNAQRTADIGIWGGSSTVFGDLDDNTPFQSFNLNYGAYFRYNFNGRVAMRVMFLNGKFAGEGLVENSPWVFDKNVQDLSVQAEINYLRYILGAKKMRFSPYVTIGLGVAYFPYNLNPAAISVFNPNHNKGTTVTEESVAVPTLPFGMGIKYTIGERLGVGVEYQMRKILSDKLDDLDDPLAYVNGKNEEIRYSDENHNTDWSGYLGVHITYTIYIGKKACPAYDAKHW
ncbi:MAG: DUF6089 family protein [Bacteroidota bacterium]